MQSSPKYFLVFWRVYCKTKSESTLWGIFTFLRDGSRHHLMMAKETQSGNLYKRGRLRSSMAVLWVLTKQRPLSMTLLTTNWSAANGSRKNSGCRQTSRGTLTSSAMQLPNLSCFRKWELSTSCFLECPTIYKKTGKSIKSLSSFGSLRCSAVSLNQCLSIKPLATTQLLESMIFSMEVMPWDHFKMISPTRKNWLIELTTTQCTAKIDTWHGTRSWCLVMTSHTLKPRNLTAEWIRLSKSLNMTIPTSKSAIVLLQTILRMLWNQTMNGQNTKAIFPSVYWHVGILVRILHYWQPI